MSPSARTATAAVVLALVAALPVAALFASAARQPELALRGSALDGHMGSLTSAATFGQGFRCAADGLRRIDVRVLATEPRELALPLELVLRQGSPDGAELRRAAFDPDRDRERLLGSWVSFEFVPLADSAGETYWLEVLPGDGAAHHYCGPWVRYRAQLGIKGRWGDGLVEAATAGARFQSPLPALSAIAVAAERVEPGARLALALRAADSDELVRAVELEPGLVRRGWVFFPFEPLAESYARHYRVELAIAGDASIRSAQGELALRTFHGRHAADPAALGMSVGGAPLGDRDLFFRTFTDADVATVARRLAERAGWRLVPAAALAWLVALLLTFALLSGRRADVAD